MKLHTPGGDEIASFNVLPFKHGLPEIMVWGDRYFLRHEGADYYEGDVHFLPSPTAAPSRAG